MDTKPVTLVVKIYDRIYNVRYPSEQRVKDLMREFATECKGSKKPGAGRRFFVCIHCGKNDFSNKLMLNVHRFEVGCEAAEYSDGTKGLLLPYPDFLPGQGKMVEVMGKHGGGSTVGKKRSKEPTAGEEDWDAGGEEENAAEDTEWASEFEGPPPSKRQNRAVRDGKKNEVRSTVPPAADLFYGAAPPKVDKAAPKQRKSKRNIGDAVNRETVKGRGEKPEKQNAPRRVTQAGGTGRGFMKVSGLTATSLEAGELGQGGPSVEEQANRGEGGQGEERHMTTNEEMMKGKKKRKVDAVGAAAEFPGVTEKQPPPHQPGLSSPTPVVSRRSQASQVIQSESDTPDAKSLQQFHVKARNPRPQKQTRELRLPTKTRYPVSVWAQDIKRIVSKDVNTVEETFVIAASLGAARALYEKYSTSQIPNPSVTLDLSPATVALDQVSRGTVLEGECLTNADGLKDVDEEGDEGSDQEQGYFYDDRGWGVPAGDTGDRVEPMELRSCHTTLQAVVDEMQVGEESIDGNEELQQHWAQGKGFPKPFQYQPEMEKRFQAREQELQRHERLYVSEEQTRADEALASLTIPPAPEKPPVPGLYHLQKFEGAVAVPWSWDHESGECFRAAWEDAYLTKDFQDVLMGCLWWWTSKKADKNLPEDIKAIKHSISAAMDLLVASRGANKPYPELRKVCAYLQWLRDYDKFIETSREYIKRRKAEINAKLSGAKAEFREKNAMLRERIIWEWCPFWKILRDHEEIFQQLPALPWRHDGYESKMVRKTLIQQRVEGMKPPPLVLVLKILFLQDYGIHRQVTCPTYGLSKSTIRDRCVRDTGMRRALTILVAQGVFQFTDLQDTGSALERRVILEITEIREGRGEALLAAVMEWVRRVQIRALQDYAAEDPQRFEDGWRTTNYYEWDSQSQFWGRSLKYREERDIGWVPSLSTPSWSCGVAKLREQILQSTRDIGVALEVEDREHWISSVGKVPAEDPKEHVPGVDEAHYDGDPAGVFVASSVPAVGDDKGSGEELTGNMEAEDDFARPMEKAHPVQVSPSSAIRNQDLAALTAFPSAGVLGVSESGLLADTNASVTIEIQKCPPGEGGSQAEGKISEENPYGEVSPLKTGSLATRAADSIQSLLRQNAETEAVTLTSTDVGAKEPRTREEECEVADQGSSAIFPEIMAAMQETRIRPDPEPLITVTQVVKGASDMDDIPPPESQLVFSLSQWIPESSTSLTSRTPPRGTMPDSGDRSGGEHVDSGPDSTAKNLESAFEQEMDMETVQQLVRLSQPCSDIASGSDIFRPRSGSLPEWAYHPEGTFDAASEECVIVDASRFSKDSLPQVYEELGLDTLLNSVPTLGEGTSRKEETVFFNQNGKELEVRHKAIRDLMKAKTRLGNDVVDFVLSRIYMAYPQHLRHEVHIVSSRVSSLLEAVMSGTKSIQRLAKDYFQPPPGVQVNEVKEMIIPWVCAGHWSVLVFQPNRVFHLDSCSDRVHFPKDLHSEFVRWMSAAWQSLRGVEEYQVHDISPIAVFQQLGNNECGHLCIRNIMLYLKFRARDTASRGVQLIGQYLKPHTAVQMNKEMMVLFARELDPTRRDTRYRAPFCQLESKPASDGDEDGLLMDGAPPPLPKQGRVTRASQKARSRNVSEDES